MCQCFEEETKKEGNHDLPNHEIFVLCVNAIFPIVHLSKGTQTVSLLVQDQVFEIPNFAT